MLFVKYYNCLLFFIFTVIIAPAVEAKVQEPHPINLVLPNNDGSKVLVRVKTWTDGKWNQKIHILTSSGKIESSIQLESHENLSVNWDVDGKFFLFHDVIAQRHVIKKYNFGGKIEVVTSFDHEQISELHFSPDNRFFLMTFVESVDKNEVFSKTNDLPLRKFLSVFNLDSKKRFTPNLTLSVGGGFSWKKDNLLFIGKKDLSYKSSWYSGLYSIGILESNKSDLETLYLDGTLVSTPIISEDKRHIAFLSDMRKNFFSDSKDPRPKVFQFSRIGLLNTHSHKTSFLPETFDGSPNLIGFSHGGHTLIFSEQEKASLKIKSIGVKSPYKKNTLNIDRSSVFFGRLSQNGKWLGYVKESAFEPPTAYIVDNSFSNNKKIFQINHKVDLSHIKESEYVWNSTDGLEIHGILNEPMHKQPPYPAVIIPHGGPTDSSYYQYLGTYYDHGVPFEIGELVRNGYLVLRPNVRGSIGYGPDFRTANFRDLGGQDWIDVQTAIYSLIKQKKVDPQRVAIVGWSYGGFLCNVGALKSNLLKTAICGAGNSNWISFDATSYFESFVPGYFGFVSKHRNQHLALLESLSPVLTKKINKIPSMLLIHGTKDLAVPINQAMEVQRMAERNGIDINLHIYPNEPHGFSHSARRTVAKEVLFWLKNKL